jgi:OmpA-OmpF porin, OOP family
MKKGVFAALALAVVTVPLASGLAGAQGADRAWYAGVDLGRSRLAIAGRDIDSALARQGIAGTSSIAHSDKNFGIAAGYRFNRNLALEAAWQRLGEFTYSSRTATDTISGRYKASALSLAGLGIYPATPSFSLYAKAGLARTSVDLNESSATGATAVSGQSHAAMGVLVGAGVTYDFAGGVFTKLGWDHYTNVGDATTGKGSIDTYAIGVGMRF